MILGGTDLRHINKAVDAYNFVSLKHLASLGGDDLDKLNGDVRLMFANGDEEFIELNTRITTQPKPGEVIYADNSTVLCRRWNWRQGDTTKIEQTSKNVVLIIEALAPFTLEEVEEMTKELEQLVQRFCGGTTKTTIAHQGCPVVSID